jgi:hypothetical protein
MTVADAALIADAVTDYFTGCQDFAGTRVFVVCMGVVDCIAIDDRGPLAELILTSVRLDFRIHRHLPWDVRH